MHPSNIDIVAMIINLFVAALYEYIVVSCENNDNIMLFAHK